MSAPDWLQYIKWEAPVRLSEAIADMNIIPAFQGFYAFNEDPGPLQVGRVLYIGETGQDGGLRARLRTYLHPDPASSTVRHSGCIWLHYHRVKESLGPRHLDDDWDPASAKAKPTNDGRIYLRWSGWESDKATRVDLETGLMQYYQAAYNKRQMKKKIDLDTV